MTWIADKKEVQIVDVIIKLKDKIVSRGFIFLLGWHRYFFINKQINWVSIKI